GLGRGVRWACAPRGWSLARPPGPCLARLRLRAAPAGVCGSVARMTGRREINIPGGHVASCGRGGPGPGGPRLPGMDDLVRRDEGAKRCGGGAAPAVGGMGTQIAPGDRGVRAGAPAGVCVLVPTRDEAGNVGPLVARLGPVLAGLGGEVLFVDDSDD